MAWFLLGLGLFASAPARAETRSNGRTVSDEDAAPAPRAKGAGSDAAYRNLEQLAAEPAFQKLLHYREARFGGFESEVDNGDFFLAKTGKSEPDAELASLLAAVRRLPNPVPDRDVSCRFPARVAWLQERLGIERAAANCPKRDRFLETLALGSVSLVYAKSSLAHPASAIGHTFLLLRHEDKHVASSVDYRGRPDTQNPFLYAFKAISGLFDGGFEIIDGQKKLHNLLEDQDRDLWEYQLDLAPAELRRFGLHLWELSQSEIDYFYLKENCSYHVLGLLEAAAPRLELIGQLKAVVQPIDTLRAAADVPGLVRQVRYFPSQSTRRDDGIEPTTAQASPLRDPRNAHGPMRLAFGPGYSSEAGQFVGASFRLTLHDLLDPAPGYPELVQIQLLGISLRYAPVPGSFTVDRAEFFDVLALNPLGSSVPLSWRVHAHGDRVRDSGCPSQDCFVHGLDAGLGLTVANRERSLALYGLATGQSVFSGALSGVGGSFVRLGVGPELGLRARFGFSTVLLVRGSLLYLPWQDLSSTYDVSANLRARLARDVAVGVEWRLQPSATEGSLASYFYF